MQSDPSGTKTTERCQDPRRCTPQPGRAETTATLGFVIVESTALPSPGSKSQLCGFLGVYPWDMALELISLHINRENTSGRGYSND